MQTDKTLYWNVNYYATFCYKYLNDFLYQRFNQNKAHAN